MPLCLSRRPGLRDRWILGRLLLGRLAVEQSFHEVDRLGLESPDQDASGKRKDGDPPLPLCSEEEPGDRVTLGDDVLPSLQVVDHEIGWGIGIRDRGDEFLPLKLLEDELRRLVLEDGPLGLPIRVGGREDVPPPKVIMPGVPTDHPLRRLGRLPLEVFGVFFERCHGEKQEKEPRENGTRLRTDDH